MEHFDTRTVHFPGVNRDKSSKVTPIYQTSAFTNTSLEDLESFYAGEKPYLYTRMGNPNTDELGAAVASLENAPAGIATSSGTSAILVGLLAVLKSGDHVVACEDLYGGTHQLLTGELKDYGIEVTNVSFGDIEGIKNAIRPSTKMIFTESISNPLLRVEALDHIVEIAKEYKLVSMVDNTFATSYLLRPYDLGIDLVVHSATKYIAGHSDVTAGVLVGRGDLIKKARDKAVRLGANLGPFDAWLACRGLKTLSVRMERQVRNAQLLADSLEDFKGVKKVFYPKYVSDKGNGAMVSIELDESVVDLSEFFKSLSWVKIVATLAGVETTVSHPAKTSHRAIPKELCEKLGINEHIIRISVGIEDSGDIIKAFQQAIVKAYKA
jgi:cystathionine beta-lyase/cystathionine gamma-synthase